MDYSGNILRQAQSGVLVTFQEEVSRVEPARKPRQNRRWKWPTVLLFAAAALGALVTLVTIWSLGPSPPIIERPSSLQAGFGSNTIKIIDQLGTVNVNVRIKNEGRFTASATCAVIVTSGTGQRQHFYRGSAAFTLTSIEPHKSKHLVEVVTGVYYDGDATGPIGSRDLPLPQYARLSKGSLVECT